MERRYSASARGVALVLRHGGQPVQGLEQTRMLGSERPVEKGPRALEERRCLLEALLDSIDLPQDLKRRGQPHVIGSMGRLEDPDRAAEQRFRFVVLSGVVVEGREVVQRRGQGGIVRSQRPLPDGERATVEGLRLRGAPSRDEADREVVQRGRDVRMVFTERPLADREDTLVELHRLRGTLAAQLEVGQVAQDDHALGMLRAQGLLVDGAGPPQERFAFVEEPPVDEVPAERVERARDVRMVGGEDRLQEGEGAAAEVLGFRGPALRAAEVGEIAEQAAHLHRARRGRLLFEGEGSTIEPLRLLVPAPRPRHGAESSERWDRAPTLRAERPFLESEGAGEHGLRIVEEPAAAQHLAESLECRGQLGRGCFVGFAQGDHAPPGRLRVCVVAEPQLGGGPEGERRGVIGGRLSGSGGGPAGQDESGG